MSEQQLIKLLKIAIVIGLLFIASGHYLLSYTNITEDWGVKGMILGAGLIAVGLIFSLPTKMYLTFLWMTKENRAIAKQKQQQQDKQ